MWTFVAHNRLVRAASKLLWLVLLVPFLFGAECGRFGVDTVSPGVTRDLKPTGNDMPTQNRSWQVIDHLGEEVASDADPRGWNVTRTDKDELRVQVPADARPGKEFSARVKFLSDNIESGLSVVFDVVDGGPPSGRFALEYVAGPPITAKAILPPDTPGRANVTVSVTDINNRGDLALVLYGKRIHAAARIAGKVTDINPPGCPMSLASDINDRGEVVGTCIEPLRNRGFVYRDGKSSYLQFQDSPVMHQEVVEATKITEDGTVLGMVQNVRIEKGRWREFAKQSLALIDRSGSARVLSPEVSPVVSLSARAVNQARTVVFSYVTSQTDWASTAGQIVLGKTEWLGNVINQGKAFTIPCAINSHGVVVGYTSSSTGTSIGEWSRVFRGFVFQPGKGMVEIPTLGGRESMASDINESGTVVGNSTIKGGDSDPRNPSKTSVRHAFVFSHGVAKDLNVVVDVPGYLLVDAAKIDDRGNILVRAEKNGARVDMILRPKG